MWNIVNIEYCTRIPDTGFMVHDIAYSLLLFLYICSFGETVELLHPLNEPFTSIAGGQVLSQFTFAQKKTRVAQVALSTVPI